MDLIESFIKSSVFRMEENLRRIEICLEHITKDELWQHANESSNSIGNLILHLNGNITQYILSSLGGIKDERVRSQEFMSDQGISLYKLLEDHAEVINQAIKVIKKLSSDSLAKERTVQGFDMDGVEIVLHVVEHYSYHTGQIAYIVKQIKNTDLGFYGDINLDKLNS